jgi:hypothetical protein
LLQRTFAKVGEVCDVWLIGTCLFFGGTIAVFVSYSFAPQSLLAPLGSAQFVSNVVFARFIHNAAVTRRMLVSTSIIMLGIALVVSFSPDPNPEFTELGVATLKELYTYRAYQVLVVVVVRKNYQLRDRRPESYLRKPAFHFSFIFFLNVSLTHSSSPPPPPLPLASKRCCFFL